jgi:hypothetical protein
MSAALMLLPSLFQAGIGMAQYFGGRKMTRQETPEYQIPSALTDAVSLQRSQLGAEMPGAESMRQQERATTQDMLRSAERGGYMSPNVVGQAYAGQQQGLRGIGMQSAMHQTREKDVHLSMLGQLAQQQGAKQEWNTLLPFERQQQAGSALMGAGMQNVWGGVGSAADFFAQRNMMQGLGYDVPSMFGQQQQQGVTDPTIRNFMQTAPQTQTAQQTALRTFVPQFFGR